MDTVEKIMKENTGKHLLDSGGAYGRHWERNQDIDFENIPVYEVEVWENDVEITYNLYHYIKNHLRYEHDLSNEFLEYARDSDASYLNDAEQFGKNLGYNIYTINTYGMENILSQNMQFTMYHTGDEPFYRTEYIALSIHNGFDIRDGYTVPRIFVPYDPVSFISNMEYVTAVAGEGLYATSDNGGWNYYGNFNKDDFVYKPKDNEVYLDTGEKVDFYVREDY